MTGLPAAVEPETARQEVSKDKPKNAGTKSEEMAAKQFCKQVNVTPCPLYFILYFSFNLFPGKASKKGLLYP